MQCRNCKNEISDKKCPVCGFNNGYRISLGTVLAILFLVAVITITTILFIRTFNEMANAGENAFYGIIMLVSSGIIALIAVLAIPYYLVILIISIICDAHSKKVRTAQNIIVFFFLMIPVIIGLLITFAFSADSYKKTYQFPDMKITVPYSMGRYGNSKEKNGDYKTASFVSKDKNCKILIGRYDYDDSISKIQNFKKFSDEYTSLNADKQVRAIYDEITTLNDVRIKEKNWSYYRGNFEYIEYRMYGIVINNNFYKIEYESKDEKVCEPLLKTTFNSVRYN